MNDPDHSDILVPIDAALGCSQCGADLVDSASSDFCSEDCQRDWHGAGKVSLSDGGWIAAERWDGLARIGPPDWFTRIGPPDWLTNALFNGETWVWIPRPGNDL